MKNLSKLLLLVGLISSSLSIAATKTDVCALDSVKPDLIANFDGAPSYFGKVTADGRYYCYISSGGNYVVDLNNPNTRVVVPGPYDPVPAPAVGANHDVKVLTMPSGGMHFFSMQEIVKKMVPGQTTDLRNQTPDLYRDPGSSHSYQSVGVLGDKSNETPVYRVLSGSLHIVDYDSKNWTIKNKIDQACGEGGRYQLPMLSKDGKELSAYDTKEGVTKILEVNDDGSCKEALNLGFPTGKVEFTYDGSAITFHVDSYSTDDSGNQFKTMNSDMTKNVYTLRLIRKGGKIVKAGALKKLTANTKKGTGSYYPSFDEKGNVVYIHGVRDPATNRVQYSFRRVNPGYAPVSEFPKSEDCPDCRKKAAAKFALGSFLMNVCGKLTDGTDSISITDASLWTLSLDPQECRDLVNKNWVKLQKKVKHDEELTKSGAFSMTELSQISKASLLAACPTKPQKKGKVVTKVIETGGPINYTGTRPPADTFRGRCYSCHDGGQATKYDWDNLSISDLSNMLIAIKDGSMPKGNGNSTGTITAQEQTELTNLFNEIQRRQEALLEAGQQ